jgi:hypothetical protein
MTFEEAFKSEIEKLGVVGRPLSHLMRGAGYSPEVQGAFLKSLRVAREPFLAEEGGKVVSHPASHEMARGLLASMRGGVIGGPDKGGVVGGAFAKAQGRREDLRVERLKAKGKLSESEAAARIKTMEAFPGASFNKYFKQQIDSAKERGASKWKDSD